MKLNVRPLKGDIFEVEVESEDKVRLGMISEVVNFQEYQIVYWIYTCEHTM